MNFKLTLIAVYLLLSVGSYGHAFKDRLMTCEQNAPNEQYYNDGDSDKVSCVIGYWSDKPIEKPENNL